MKIADWQELEKTLVWVYRGPPHGAQGTYAHPHLSAWLMEAGQITLTSAHGSCTFGEGQWVFPPLRHDTRVFSQDARILSVSFTLCWPNGRMLFESLKPLAVSAREVPELERCARRLLKTVSDHLPEPHRNLKWHNADLPIYLAIEEAFANWVLHYIMLMRNAEERMVQWYRADERVVQARFVLDHFDMSQKFRVSDLVREIGLCASHLNRLFIAEYGMSLRAYYDQRRRQGVLDDVVRTKLPLKEIAYRYAFHDASAFSNWVKKQCGESPQRLRSHRY